LPAELKVQKLVAKNFTLEISETEPNALAKPKVKKDKPLKSETTVNPATEELEVI
jgi:hypothetical protein